MIATPTDIRPPFSLETALAKVQAAEDAWNSHDPERVALAYSENSDWRNRAEFLRGRDEIRAWYRSYGNELWDFDDSGLMARRYASINDAPIEYRDRRISFSG